MRALVTGGAGFIEWRPKTKIKEGVDKMLALIDDYRDAPVWTPETIKDATADWFRYLA